MMKKFAQFDEAGRVYAVVETSGELIALNVVEVAAGLDPMGKRWDGAGFEEIIPDVAEVAAAELRKIDADTGMSRMMRETLLAIAGNAAPAKLIEAETKAATERAKLAK